MKPDLSSVAPIKLGTAGAIRARTMENANKDASNRKMRSLVAANTNRRGDGGRKSSTIIRWKHVEGAGNAEKDSTNRGNGKNQDWQNEAGEDGK